MLQTGYINSEYHSHTHTDIMIITVSHYTFSFCLENGKTNGETKS